jgi:hypothetical protein
MSRGKGRRKAHRVLGVHVDSDGGVHLAVAIGPDGNPVLVREDEDGKTRVSSASPVCDFCCEPGPRWTLPVGDVAIVGNPILNHSDTDWGVCDACRPLVAARDVDALARRSWTCQTRLVALRSEHNDRLRTRIPPTDVALARIRANLTNVFAAVTGELYENS